jgi:hypothetical protein
MKLLFRDTGPLMPYSNRVFNALYYRYRAGVAQTYIDSRNAGKTCVAAVIAARDYSKARGA